MTLTGYYDTLLSENDKYTCKAYKGIAVRARVSIGTHEFLSDSFVYNEATLNTTLTPTNPVVLGQEVMANFYIEALEDTIEQADVVQNLKIEYYNRKRMFSEFSATYGTQIELNKKMFKDANFIVDTNGTATLYFNTGGQTTVLMQTDFQAAATETWKNASQQCDPLKLDCAKLIQLVQSSTSYSMWYEVLIYQNNFLKQQKIFTSIGESKNVQDSSNNDVETPCCYLPDVSGVPVDARYQMVFRQNVTLLQSKDEITEISNVRVRVFEDQFQIEQSVSGQHNFAPGYTIANLIFCMKTDHTHCFTLQSNEPKLFPRVVIKCEAVVGLDVQECREDILDLFETQEAASAALYYQTTGPDGLIIEQFDVAPQIVAQCYQNAVINIYSDEVCILIKKRDSCSVLAENTLLRLQISGIHEVSHVFSFPSEANEYCIKQTLSLSEMRQAAMLKPADVSLYIKSDIMPVASVNSLARRSTFEWGWAVDVFACIIIPLVWWGCSKCKCSKRRKAKTVAE